VFALISVVGIGNVNFSELKANSQGTAPPQSESSLEIPVFNTERILLISVYLWPS
jgi:hypothetical protein